VTIDVGTGDGRAILATAAAEPTTLAIGIDADAASMAEASRRATRAVGKGGLPNALFVVAAAESVPSELCGIAARVTVQFPWGSLLRGCLDGGPAVADGLAALVAPGGTLELLLAPAARDGLAGVSTDPVGVVAAVERAFGGSCLRIEEARTAAAAELRASHSSWARRLLSNPSTDRAAILVRLRS